MFLHHKNRSRQFLIPCQGQSFAAYVKSYQSEEDIESDSHCLNCSKGCNWWVHSRSMDIHYENSDTGEKGLDRWAKDHYFYAKHMPRAEPVGWDAEKEEEILLENKWKSFKACVNKIKKIKSKNVKGKKFCKLPL